MRVVSAGFPRGRVETSTTGVLVGGATDISVSSRLTAASLEMFPPARGRVVTLIDHDPLDPARGGHRRTPLEPLGEGCARCRRRSSGANKAPRTSRRSRL